MTELLKEQEEYIDDGTLEEVELEIYEQSWDGGSAKKVDIRGREQNGTRGLDVGEYIEVVKRFAEAKKTYTDSEKDFELHQASVEYKGENVGITMYGRDAKKFNEAGGEGDTVRIQKRRIWNDAVEKGFSRYEFVKVE